MKINAYAKVNLTLKVFPKKVTDKLHKIESIMTLVDDLYDTIEIINSDDNLWHIETNISELNNKNNYVFIIANAIRNDFHLHDKSIKLIVTKSIPIESGLGGGSSDAMATLELLNNFFNLNMSRKQKWKYAQMIGSDCFFFLSKAKTALVTGNGDKIETIKTIPFFKKNLFFSKISCSTKMVYKAFDEYYDKEWEIFNNNLIIPCFKIYPKLETEFKRLRKKHKNISISGSGSTFINWPLLK